MAKHNKPQAVPTPPKPDCIWDTINEFSAVAFGLSRIPAQLIPFLRNETLMANIKDRLNVANQIRSISNDVKVYGQSLQEIASRHHSKRGSTATPDEHLEALMVGEDYINWCVQFQGVVLSTVVDVLEQFAHTSSPESEEAKKILAEINQANSTFKQTSLPTGDPQ